MSDDLGSGLGDDLGDDSRGDVRGGLDSRLASWARAVAPAVTVASAARMRARGDRRRRLANLRIAAVAVVTCLGLSGGTVLAMRHSGGPDRTSGVGPSASAYPTADSSPDRKSPEPERSATGASPTRQAGASACPAFPAFPDAACTGWQHTGVTLRPCVTRLSNANTTYDGCLFAGTVTVAAASIKVTRSRIAGRVEAAGGSADLRGLTLIDVEIDGGGNADLGQVGIGNNNFTCLRCNIHGTARGAGLGGNVVIRDSYLHDFVPVAGGQTAISSNGGSDNQIVHNTLQCNAGGGCSTALALYGDDAPVSRILVQHNLFNAESGYCTIAGSVNGKRYPNATNVRYLDNRFGRKYASGCAADGPVASWRSNAGNEWRGNKWDDGTGDVVP